MTGSIKKSSFAGEKGETAAPDGANECLSPHVCMRCVSKIRQHAVLATNVKLQGTSPATGSVAQCSFNGTYQIFSQTAVVVLPFLCFFVLIVFFLEWQKNSPHPAAPMLLFVLDELSHANGWMLPNNFDVEPAIWFS